MAKGFFAFPYRKMLEPSTTPRNTKDTTSVVVGNLHSTDCKPHKQVEATAPEPNRKATNILVSKVKASKNLFLHR